MKPDTPSEVIQEEPLEVAAELVRRLHEAGVRYGLYKNTGTLCVALAGRCDLDLIVASADMARFRTIVRELYGVRGLCHRFSSDAGAGREDWFLPDFGRADYIYLDVRTELFSGPKFAKRYPEVRYEDIRAWQTAPPPFPPIPLVTPDEEARIAVLRSMFRRSLRSGEEWVRLNDRTSLLGQEEFKWFFQYRFGKTAVVCPVRNAAGTLEVDGGALRALRNAWRVNYAGTPLAAVADFSRGQMRRLIFSGARRLSRFSPALSAARRRIDQGGAIFALVGPDGVGKSSQAARVASLFQRKFRCTTVYLGSGEGGWKLRRLFQRWYHSWQSGLHRRRPSASATRPLARALASFAAALERYIMLAVARGLARKGAIVITDRWPQNLRPGLLDGPSRIPLNGSAIVRFLGSIERSLYRRMEIYEPDLTIHLLSDFETSNERKPGASEPARFEQRLAVMRMMRARSSHIRTVDVRRSFPEVTQDIFRSIWLTLWRRAGRASNPEVGGSTPSERTAPVRKGKVDLLCEFAVGHRTPGPVKLPMCGGPGDRP
ncbi:MAG: hypothetical protein M3Q19_00490 [Pseudomonadota bacterium]|nr:hypothetical protein [Pseudomonadota bacterium]